MIRMINGLFKSYNYIDNSIGDDVLFVIDESSGETVFWLVIQESDLDSLVNRQSELFDACRQVGQNSALDKNISLLVLWETGGDLDLGEMKKKVMSVEEDPYFFKKYVLYYSRQELDSFNAAMGNNSLYNFLQQHVASQDVFATYKNNPLSQDWQPLLYRIAIKVPFLEIDIGRSDGIDSLLKMNNEKIEKNSDKELFEIDRCFFGIEDTNTTAEKYLSELLPLIERQNDGD